MKCDVALSDVVLVYGRCWGDEKGQVTSKLSPLYQAAMDWCWHYYDSIRLGHPANQFSNQQDGVSLSGCVGFITTVAYAIASCYTGVNDPDEIQQHSQ